MTAVPAEARALHRLELSLSGLVEPAAASLVARLEKLPGVGKVIPNPLTQRVVVVFDPVAIGVESIIDACTAEAAGADLALARWYLPVIGLSCARCARRVEEAIGRLPGVRAAIVNREVESLAVEFTVGRTQADAVQAALLAQGFEPGPPGTAK